MRIFNKMILNTEEYWKPTLQLFINVSRKSHNVKTVRAYKYRIYPSKRQEVLLQASLCECKDLWNYLLQYAKEYHEKTGKFPSRYAFIKLTKGKSTKLHSQSAQNTADRLHKAIEGAILRKRRGMKAGFPRFKPIERIKSITYPQSGFRLEDALCLSKIGKIQIRKHREIGGTIKTLTIKRMPSGKWYAFFSAEAEITPGIRAGKPLIGLDLGIEHFAYLSNGSSIENPRHLQSAEKKLKHAQMLLSKKKKGSQSRIKAKLKVARAYERVANSRRDFLHKSSRMLANSYSFIAMENLDIARMEKGFLAKSILDCSWAEFTRMLAYKAEEAGCEVVLVNPAGTTQECSQCGSVKKKSLAERWHSCACGASMHRDLNAAINILKRATAGTAGSKACREGAPTHYKFNGASILYEAGNSAL